MTIRTKFLLFFLTASILPLIFLALVNFNSARQMLINDTKAKLSSIAKLQALRVDEVINLYTYRATSLATQLPRISDLDTYNRTKDKAVQSTMTKSLMDTTRLLPDIQTMSLMNTQGEVVASTDMSMLGQKQSIAFPTTIPKTIVPSLDFIHHPGATPQVRIRRIIMNDTNPIGELEIVMKSYLIPTITNESTNIGSSGELLLATREEDGKVLYIVPRHFEKRATGQSYLMDQALGKRESFFSNATDYRGVSVVGVTKYLSDVHWGIVIKIDSEEAFQPVNTLRDSILLFAFIFILIILFVALFFTNSITTPLINIVSVIREVGKGNLAKRALVLSKDETGEVATGLNSMLDTLQTASKNITKELEMKSALAAIINFSEDAIIEKKLDGTVISWNKSAERMYGYSAQEMIGKSITKIAPQNRIHEIFDILEKIKNDKSIKEMETLRKKKDGSLINVALSASPIKDAKGKVVSASVIERDITERKKLQEAEIKLLVVDALREANKELEAFSYSVSHDLRAPLRAIDGFSRILVEDYAEKLDDEGKHVIETIRTSTQQMGKLIDDLLAFSRLGRTPVKEDHIDMTTMVETTFDELKLAVPDRVIHFTCEELPQAYGDTTLLRQVWVNLLSNAIKFTKKKESSTISVGARNEEDRVIYYVKDNGAGFDMKYVDKLFRVFQRLHDVTEFEGTGVGLAIVSRTITKHGGEVWAQAKVNQGATFYFSLPTVPFYAREKTREKASQG